MATARYRRLFSTILATSSQRRSPAERCKFLSSRACLATTIETERLMRLTTSYGARLKAPRRNCLMTEGLVVLWGWPTMISGAAILGVRQAAQAQVHSLPACQNRHRH